MSSSHGFPGSPLPWAGLSEPRHRGDHGPHGEVQDASGELRADAGGDPWRPSRDSRVPGSPEKQVEIGDESM